MAHTPGPWELRASELGGITGLIYPVESEYPVASTTGYHAGHRLHNARLIAAAPELLAALKWAVKHEGACLGDYPELLEQAKKLIAKAIGATP